jgi:ferredoxin
VPESGARLAISVDRDLCMGSGTCILYAPSTFAHDDETRAIVIDPTGDPVSDIRVAVEACPTGALSLVLEEEEGA